MKHEAALTHDSEHLKHVETKSLGFWLYLMSDLVIFSILFTTFVVLGHNYAGGPGPKELFSIPFLFAETMLLLISSVTYGFAMIAMKENNTRQLMNMLGATFLLGAGFISMELFEFFHLFIEGHTPQQSAFLSAFFTLVGTHGLHVIFGLLWMIIMMYQVNNKGLDLNVRSRLMMLSLFWHFLDIVWVGVFTIVYLADLV